MRIDAHQHFWKFDPMEHDWINDEMAEIRRDFLPIDLANTLNSNRIEGCVAVQVNQTEIETLSLVRLARENEFIKGVVGWVNLMAPDIDDRLEVLLAHSEIKGFRHVVQGLPQGFLLQKEFLNGISALGKLELTYDLLIYHYQLPEAITFVRQFPRQKFVIDHLAKPDIKNGTLEPWKKNITELASFENVYCKLSGMVTEADFRNWKIIDFEPYLTTVLEAFGTKRVLYGSDWPVCLVAASYSQQLGIVEEFIGSLSPFEKRRIMGENAAQFYNL